MALNTENTQLEKIYCDKFDANQVSSLSLFLFEDFYFYFAKDQNGEVLAVIQQPYDSQRLLTYKLKEEKLLRQDVPTKVHLHISPFVVVPGVLFEPGLSKVYLFFADKPKENLHVFDSKLQSNNIHLIGSIHKDLKEVLSQNKSDIQFHHAAASFLSFVLKEKFNLIHEELLLNVQNRCFYLAAFKNQELVVFNKFEIGDKEDLLKYLIGVSQQHGFNRHVCRVSVYGAVHHHGITEEWGSEYFQNFKLPEPYANQHFLGETKRFQKPEIFESYWEQP